MTVPADANGEFVLSPYFIVELRPPRRAVPCDCSRVNVDGTSVWKVGSTVPLKFTICDANGNPISDSTAVFATGYGSITLINTVRGTVDQRERNNLHRYSGQCLPL
jgi:hypothetical protein